ncbi:MAG: chromosome segregation protein SMC [Liquorilactobacillus satsumensis]|uniref:chromosome segregation protein SMC n=1 Tax=Liquorilactobacillus satsumensis TaxID=259059 RepID=UPI0039E9E2C9
MKLKSLVINGFKSFADKTQIDFQTGMTAIVGPNGSGKSNVIEAIRWVLGEQSAKSLRSGKMPDVIFAGASERKPLNRASVTITFTNTDRYLPLNEDEVVITRRIYRDGDSEFLLNGKQVRLKDITGLMLDTGLGKESFSIISQGRVEAIFKSKPEERRAIIEEVAGVLKYKKEKQKAQQELAQTTEHLNRVADIVGELGNQREPLKKQSSLAKDYLAQKKDFDHYNLARLVLEIERDRAKKEDHDAELNKLLQLSAQKRAALAQIKQQTADLQQQQHELNEQLDALQERSVEVAEQHERLSGQRELSQKEKDFQQLRQQELEKKHQEDLQRSKHLAVQKRQLLEQLKTLEATQNTLQHEIKALKHVQGLDEATLEQEIEELRSQIITKMQEQTTLTNQLTYLEKERQREAATQSSFAKKRAEIAQITLQLEDEAQKLKTQLDRETAKTAQLEAGVMALKKQLAQKQQKFAAQKKRWYQGLEILQRAQAQHDSLKSVSENYAGYFHGVKEILRVRGQFKGIIGSVAERLNVPAQLAVAVEMSLGSQLQNVVVTDEEAAKRAIAYLTQKKLGRVTFLPRTAVRQRRLSSYQQKTVESCSGVLGVGSQLITSQTADLPILNYLLGTTVFVENIEIAIELAKKLEHSVRVVTLAGDVINPGGSITGGALRQRSSGLLEQKQKIQQLTANIKTMQAKMKELEIAGNALQGELDDGQRQITAQEEQCAQKQQSQQATKNELAVVENKLKYQRQQNELRQLEFQSSQQTGSNFAAQKQKIKHAQVKLNTQVQQLQDSYQQKKAELTNLNKSQQQNQSHLNEIRQKLAVAAERLASLRAKQKELDEQAEQLRLEDKETQAALQQFVRQVELDSQQGSTWATRIANLEAEKEQLAVQISQGKKKRSALHEQLVVVQKENVRLTELQEIALNQQKEQSVLLNGINTALDRNLQELSQEYSLSFEAAKLQIKEENIEHVLHQLKLLKLGLKELGNVNLNAIEEYEQINQRYQFLETQQTDLLEAKKQLQNSMQEMDNEVRVRFKQTFKDVAAAFSKLFPQIFGGGQAALKLTAPEDLLTTGIEIMAQPPGKKLQQLSLLSGGEKALTAITLLFAILKVKPVPFVILDEAEAALDDANVERYAQYLRHFHAQTQFIIITHRKGTMEHADILYGITMQESGVSRMVSVSLANTRQ